MERDRLEQRIGKVMKHSLSEKGRFFLAMSTTESNTARTHGKLIPTNVCQENREMRTTKTKGCGVFSPPPETGSDSRWGEVRKKWTAAL
jgi:hypothetical protein